MPFNKTTKKSSCRPISIILFSAVIIVSVLTAVAVCDEIRISDSVTPMKIEISPASDSDANGMISKTVSLRNTGDVPVNYVIYMESGGNSNAASLFELSAAAASVAPGGKFDLQISASKSEIEKYTAAELENIKIKLIRNPDTQTPVGYIIPVTVGGKTETKTTNGAAGETDSFETAAGVSGANQTGLENPAASGKNAAANGSGVEKEDENAGRTISNPKKMNEKYKIIIAVLAACFVLLAAAGLYAVRKRMKE
ncbi:MAG: hypothetical protein FWE78_00845 [Methanimicrococcus sp.]|nr:hypothetical protein [Methanimicrococcus sp.]